MREGKFLDHFELWDGMWEDRREIEGSMRENIVRVKRRVKGMVR